MLLLSRLAGVCAFDSISHYYYSSLGALFGIALAFIGTFLIAYRGESVCESWLANVAGLGAFLVAFFPTEGHGGCADKGFSGRAFVSFGVDAEKQPFCQAVKDMPTKLTCAANSDVMLGFKFMPIARYLHYGGAVVVFVTLLFFCLFVFTRIDPWHRDETGAPTAIKLRRNRLYQGSGWVILVCIGALGGPMLLDEAGKQWLNGWNLTFWFESFALLALGLSWSVRGRIFDLNRDPMEPVRRSRH